MASEKLASPPDLASDVVSSAHSFSGITLLSNEIYEHYSTTLLLSVCHSISVCAHWRAPFPAWTSPPCPLPTMASSSLCPCSPANNALDVIFGSHFLVLLLSWLSCPPRYATSARRHFQWRKPLLVLQGTVCMLLVAKQCVCVQIRDSWTLLGESHEKCKFTLWPGLLLHIKPARPYRCSSNLKTCKHAVLHTVPQTTPKLQVLLEPSSWGPSKYPIFLIHLTAWVTLLLSLSGDLPKNQRQGFQFYC